MINLVPLVDLEQPCDPARNWEAARYLAQCLLQEGWSVEQVSEWSRALTMLSPHCLRAELTVRAN